MTHEDKPLLDKLLDQNPNLPFWFNTSIGILLTLIGSITIFQLLTTAMPHLPQARPDTMGRPVSDLVAVPDDKDVSMDVAENGTREHGDLARQRQIAKAIFVAVPTTIIGSITATALVSRRKLGPLPAEENT